MNRKVFLIISFIISLCSCTSIKFNNWDEHDLFFNNHTWTKWESEDNSFVWYVEGSSEYGNIGIGFYTNDPSNLCLVEQRTSKSSPDYMRIQTKSKTMYLEKKINKEKPNELKIKMERDFITFYATKIVESDINARYFMSAIISNKEEELRFIFDSNNFFETYNKTIFDQKKQKYIPKFY